MSFDVRAPASAVAVALAVTAALVACGQPPAPASPASSTGAGAAPAASNPPPASSSVPAEATAPAAGTQPASSNPPGASAKPGAPGAMCGGIAGFRCGDGLFCDFPLEAHCGAADQTGTCQPTPGACTRIYKPVCGCDDHTYPTECVAHASGVSVAHEGECKEPSNKL